MKRLLIILALGVLLCGCNTVQVTGTYTDNYGVKRVAGIDLEDGALVSIPAAQVQDGVQAGDCIEGAGFYSKVECPQ